MSGIPIHCCGNVREHDHRGKWPSNSYEAKYTPTLCPNNSTPGYLPKRNKNIFKNFYKDNHTGFIHNSPKLETALVSIKKRLDKLWESQQGTR